MNSYTSSENVFTEILDNEDYLNSQYEILVGTFPKNYNEIVIIVDKDNIISDSVLYALVKRFADISNIAIIPIDGAIFFILLSVGLNVIAGIIPAKMAAKKDPVVALRSE